LVLGVFVARVVLGLVYGAGQRAGNQEAFTLLREADSLSFIAFEKCIPGDTAHAVLRRDYR